MNYYNTFIDKCYSELPEDLTKLSINLMIGNFKPNIDKHVSTETIGILNNERAAMYHYLNTKSSFIKRFTIENKNYFHVLKNTKNYKMDTEAPI